jgi:hypothetical protein
MKMFSPDGQMIMNPDVLPDGTKNPDAGKPVAGKPLLVDDLKKKFPHISNDQMLEYYYEFLKQEQEKDKNGKGKGQGKGIIFQKW